MNFFLCSLRDAMSAAAVFVARLLIYFYRATLGIVLPTSCKYYPSCSHFAEDAIVEHGAWRGGWMAVKRIARCHPFARGGYDPVRKGGVKSIG